MTRRAHLYFLLGMFLAFATFFAVWVSVIITGQLWTTSWAWTFVVLEAIGILLAIRSAISYAKWQKRRLDWVSRELPSNESKRLRRLRPVRTATRRVAC